MMAALADVPSKKRSGASASSSSPSSWTLFRRIVSSCKFDAKEGREGCSASLCNLREVVHANRRVMHCKGETSPQNSSTQTSNQSAVHGNQLAYPKKPQLTGMHLKRWSGCYECHMIVDPIDAFSRDSITTICACPSCGEIFSRAEALEHHQLIKHAVSELSEEDSARNVVEIIFQSSWLKKENPICKIERILKVHNTQKTMNKFEEYRDIVKAKANKLAKKHARCIADGNELLRFHCTTFACSLGMKGSSSLCALPSCNICNVIKNGFSSSTKSEIYTSASSGRAHDAINGFSQGKRAMVVCRVIAGRVQRKDKGSSDDFVAGGFDSVAGQVGIYSNLDDLSVYNPKAVLPCFVVIYKTLEG